MALIKVRGVALVVARVGASMCRADDALGDSATESARSAEAAALAVLHLKRPCNGTLKAFTWNDHVATV